jgi:hypothetical protein
VLRLTSHHFEIQCDRVADRFCSEILVKEGDDSRVALRSIEGSNQDFAPPSPPIQQAVLDEIAPDQKAILGVGMSGKSHWSSSIHWDQTKSQLVFDIACRCNETIAWLGSTYECGEHAHVELHSEGLILQLDNRPVAKLVALDNCTLSVVDQKIQVSANLTNSEKLPRTIRWQYAIQVP